MAPIGGIGGNIGANFGSALELLQAGNSGGTKKAASSDAVEGGRSRGNRPR